ncbi:MAG: methylamine utilization protein [Pseudomonadota bacterium]
MEKIALHVVTLFACLSVGASAFGASEASVSVTVKDARGVPVREAVVMVYPATAANKPMRFGPNVMAQRDLAFAPGTLIAAKGSSISFPNFDRVRHSVYSFSKAARFEINLYGKDQSRSQKFPIAGSVALGCNIHDNMRGYIKVVDTPFAAKTDNKGLVTLTGLSAGAATVKVWHPQARAANNEVAFQTSLIAGGNERRFTLNVRQN